jgi:hypothetical protein
MRGVTWARQLLVGEMKEPVALHDDSISPRVGAAPSAA